MENARDIAAQIAAVRERFEQLAGPMESSKGQAEAFSDALAQLGLEERAKNAKAVAERVEQHQALRAAIAGGLAKAHWLMLSVINGTMGPGASGPTSSVIDNKDGTTSWYGTIDGIKTEIVYGHEPEIDPGPNGEQLLEPRRPKNRHGAMIRTAVKEDATDPAKSITQSLADMTRPLRDHSTPPSTTASTMTTENGYTFEVQQPIPESRAVPIPQLTAGNIAELAMVATVITMKGGEAIASSMKKMSNSLKERKRNDHE